MGLFDAAIDLFGNMQKSGGDPKRILVESVLGMLSGGAQQGGLHGMIAAFQQAGLGGIIHSWIGTGENAPISADQLLQVLGSDRIAELAGKLGISPESVTGHLAEVMPGVIDKLTPDGNVPASGLENLGGLVSRFFPKI